MFVRVHGSIIGMDVSLDHRDDGAGLAVGFDLNHSVAFALDHTHHHSLTNGAPSGVEFLRFVLVLFQSADVGLVNLYFPE